MARRIRSSGSAPTTPTTPTTDRTLRAIAATAGAALALGLAGAAPAAGDAAAPREIDPTLAEIGRETFQRRCASCHGVDARGAGPVARALVKPPTDLTRIAARHDGAFPAGEIARFIDGRYEVTAHGTRQMPVWGERIAEDVPDARLAEEISRGTIASLVEYLRSIQVEAPEPGGEADGAREEDGS